MSSLTCAQIMQNETAQAKRHLRRFNGIPRQHSGLFLKECEWRFCCSDPREKLRQLKQWVKRYMGELARTAPSVIARFSRTFSVVYFQIEVFFLINYW